MYICVFKLCTYVFLSYSTPTVIVEVRFLLWCLKKFALAFYLDVLIVDLHIYSLETILLPFQRLIFSLISVYYVVEMDEEDCERRRMECLDEMSNLEKQFTDLKEQ